MFFHHRCTYLTEICSGEGPFRICILAMNEALFICIDNLPFQTLGLLSVPLNTVSKQQTHASHCDGDNAECGAYLNEELHEAIGIPP
jgi:hypothetical protein